MSENAIFKAVRAAVNDLVTKGGLTIQASEIITSLQANFNKAENEVVHLQNTLAERTQDLRQTAERYEKHLAASGDLEAKLVALNERELKLRASELEAAVAKAERTVMDRFLDKLLANRFYREMLSHNRQLPVNYSGGGTGWDQRSESKMTEGEER